MIVIGNKSTVIKKSKILFQNIFEYSVPERKRKITSVSCGPVQVSCYTFELIARPQKHQTVMAHSQKYEHRRN